MTTLKAIVQNRRIDVPAPLELHDGTEVELTIAAAKDRSPSEAISLTLQGMQQLGIWDIPEKVSKELDEFERRINQRGLTNCEPNPDSTFQ